MSEGFFCDFCGEAKKGKPDMVLKFVDEIDTLINAEGEEVSNPFHMCGNCSSYKLGEIIDVGE